MQGDWQQVTAFAIVTLAAWSVGKRLWGQIAAFRSRPARRAKSPARPAAPRPEKLMQIQLKPPLHVKRPPADDAKR